MAEQTAYELFASDDQLAELEALHAVEPATAAMPLAWALRQRDPDWALNLACEADVPPVLEPRRALVQAWVLTSQGQLDEAQTLGEQAEAAFAVAGDALGLIDARLLAAQIINDRSMSIDVGPTLRQALAHAERAGDPVRLAFCAAVLAGADMMRFGLEIEQTAGALLPAPGSVVHPAVASHVAMYHGVRVARQGDYRGCVPFFIEAYEHALRSGQAWQAGIMANNLALTYSELGDLALALEWGQAMMGVARKAWPALLGQSLSTNTTLLCAAGQLSEARDMANECLQREAGRPASRSAIAALEQLGLIELACEQPEAALASFETALGNPAIWPTMRFQIEHRRTEALLRLGRLAPALEAAQVCVETSERDCTPVDRLLVRGLQADIWLAQGQAERAQQAYALVLEESRQLPEFAPPASFYAAAAGAYAAVGLHARAYELGRCALETQERRHSHLAEQRSRALYSQFRVERSQLEAEHLRSLAEASAERLDVLERNHAVLEQLGAIGRELTAQLDASHALAVLSQHVRTLLPVDCLIVYLLDATGQKLECALCEEQGQALQAPTLGLDDPVSLTARCARERQVLLLQDEASQGLGVSVQGLADKRSCLFAPLHSGKRLVGVMSVQSAQAEAFGPEPRLIFATLCAYAAIALDNAQAYQRVGQMQRQLRAQERMAALGSMVAGVAHELNTPLGNALLAVSTLSEQSVDLEQRVGAGTLRRSDLQLHVETLRTGLRMIANGVDTSLRLVDNFRQVAQRRDAQQRRRFGLAALCRQSLLVRSSQAQRSGHSIEIDVPPELELNSYAYAIDQALDILVGNALQHGLGERKPGRVRIQAQCIDGEHCRLEVIDDGCGMAPEVLQRAFEPFFTTTFGKGGNGLGLSICHTLVADVLGGQIEAFSEAGRGSRFVMELPLTAP